MAKSSFAVCARADQGQEEQTPGSEPTACRITCTSHKGEGADCSAWRVSNYCMTLKSHDGGTCFELPQRALGVVYWLSSQLSSPSWSSR